jgi:hypothetical protein
MGNQLVCRPVGGRETCPYTITSSSAWSNCGNSTSNHNDERSIIIEGSTAEAVSQGMDFVAKIHGEEKMMLRFTALHGDALNAFLLKTSENLQVPSVPVGADIDFLEMAHLQLAQGCGGAPDLIDPFENVFPTKE